ncbi:glutamate-5-semialdehyde dehydrogenase [Caldicellulosiruptoraceae bacterium PP1]
MSDLVLKAQNVNKASKILINVSENEKNEALKLIKQSLIDNIDYILEENQKDMKNAENKGVKGALLDRLKLTKERILGICNGIDDVIALKDPVGEIISMWKRPNGLIIGQKRVPIGAIGIIYEARPNVTVDAAVLCLKAGNAVLLRGGSEAINSNIALVNVMKKGLSQSNIPESAIEIVEDTSRETAVEMMKLNQYLDLLIPRGGANLIKTVVQNSTVPVIETGVGNCHVYVDKTADFKMAKDIVINAKTQRPGVCNAAEKLIVHEEIAHKFLPEIAKLLIEKGVEIRGCSKTFDILKNNNIEIKEAKDEDWGTEYLDLIIGIKVVSSVDEAIEHINRYGTKHSEAIVTSDYFNAQKFLDLIDAAAVYVNASTRFTDGFEFGFGAEIGISTQKLHARGPMGLKELTTIKYIIYGNGQIRG